MNNIWLHTKGITAKKFSFSKFSDAIYAYIIDEKKLMVVSQAYPKFDGSFDVLLSNTVAYCEEHGLGQELRYSAYEPDGDWIPENDATVVIRKETYAPTKERRYDIRKELEDGRVIELNIASMDRMRELWKQHPFKSYDFSHILALLMDRTSRVRVYGYVSNSNNELVAFGIFLKMYPEMFYWLATGGYQSSIVDHAYNANLGDFEYLDLGGCRRPEALEFKKQFGGTIAHMPRWVLECAVPTTQTAGSKRTNGKIITTDGKRDDAFDGEWKPSESGTI